MLSNLNASAFCWQPLSKRHFAHSMTLRLWEDIQLFVAQYYRLSVVGIYLSTIVHFFSSVVPFCLLCRMHSDCSLVKLLILPLIYANSVSMKPTHLHSISHFRDKIRLSLHHMETMSCFSFFARTNYDAWPVNLKQEIVSFLNEMHFRK